MYRITYDNGLVQEKRLISHFEYKTRIVPDQFIIHALTSIKVKDANKMEAYKKQASAIKSALKKDYPEEYFTDQSPLFEAITTGVIDLSTHMGEKYKFKCKIEKI